MWRNSTARAERVSAQGLSLTGLERARYFGPVFFCGYLAALCMALVVVSVFVVMADARAVTAAGLFGFCLSGGLGLWILQSQRRELRYSVVLTRSDARANYQIVRQRAIEVGWRLVADVPGHRLRAETVDSILSRGEIVVVEFQQNEARIASICDPNVGFSLLGRRRCAQNRLLVRGWLEG